jgi:hypothetical protein
VDKIPPVVEAVGRNMAYETGIRVGLSMAARLLTGFLCGLPATAISVSATTAFFATVVLEVPTGVFADFFGRTRSVRLGYHCQAVASLCTFLAIAVFPASRSGMWFFIIAEAVIDALGNALLSGAREASYQSIVESATESLEEPRKGELRKRYLSLAEAYGRPALVLFPLVTLSSVLLLHSYGRLGHYGMLLIVGGWIAIDRQYASLARLAPAESSAVRPLTRWKTDARTCVSLVRDGAMIGPVLLWMVDRFVFITVTCYVPVAVLKDPGLWPAENVALPVLTFASVFVAGRASRSFVLPALARDRANEALLRLGGLAQGALAAAVLFLPLKGGPAYVIFAALAFGAYDIASGLVERPSLGLILDALPEGIRATFLSLMSAAVLSAQALYSLRLTAMGTGVPRMTEIWTLALAGGGAILVLSALRAPDARSNVLRAGA